VPRWFRPAVDLSPRALAASHSGAHGVSAAHGPPASFHASLLADLSRGCRGGGAARELRVALRPATEELLNGFEEPRQNLALPAVVALPPAARRAQRGRALPGAAGAAHPWLCTLQEHGVVEEGRAGMERDAVLDPWGDPDADAGDPVETALRLLQAAQRRGRHNALRAPSRPLSDADPLTRPPRPALLGHRSSLYVLLHGRVRLCFPPLPEGERRRVASPQEGCHCRDHVPPLSAGRRAWAAQPGGPFAELAARPCVAVVGVTAAGASLLCSLAPPRRCRSCAPRPPQQQRPASLAAKLHALSGHCARRRGRRRPSAPGTPQPNSSGQPQPAQASQQQQQQQQQLWSCLGMTVGSTCGVQKGGGVWVEVSALAAPVLLGLPTHRGRVPHFATVSVAEGSFLLELRPDAYARLSRSMPACCAGLEALASFWQPHRIVAAVPALVAAFADTTPSHNWSASDRAGTMSALAALARPVILSPGEALFSEGDPADAAYIVVTGLIAVSALASSAGTQALLAVCGRGSCVGESGLVGRGRAESDARRRPQRLPVLLRLSHDSLSSVLARRPRIWRAVRNAVVWRGASQLVRLPLLSFLVGGESESGRCGPSQTCLASS